MSAFSVKKMTMDVSPGLPQKSMTSMMSMHLASHLNANDILKQIRENRASQARDDSSYEGSS